MDLTDDVRESILGLSSEIFQANYQRLANAAKASSEDRLKQMMVFDSYALLMMEKLTNDDPRIKEIFRFDLAGRDPKEILSERVAQEGLDDEVAVDAALESAAQVLSVNYENLVTSSESLDSVDNGPMFVRDTCAVAMFKTLYKIDTVLFEMVGFNP